MRHAAVLIVLLLDAVVDDAIGVDDADINEKVLAGVNTERGRWLLNCLSRDSMGSDMKRGGRSRNNCMSDDRCRMERLVHKKVADGESQANDDKLKDNKMHVVKLQTTNHERTYR